MADFDQDDGSQYGSYQDDATHGDGLTRIQWRHGDKKHQSPGFFFLAKESAPEGFTPGGSWAAHSEYFESTDKTVEGWKCDKLPVSIICARAQPYVRGEKGDAPIWLDAWDASRNCAMHADVLLVADGLQDLGPVKWSTNGSTVAFAIIGRADPKRDPAGGILYRIREEVLAAADAVSKVAYRKKKNLYWLFWITIGTERDAKGNIVYTPTKGPMVTLPRVQLPAELDAAWLKKAFVGTDMATYGEEMRGLYDEWKQTKFTNDAPQAQTPAGRNVAQPVEDLPF